MDSEFFKDLDDRMLNMIVSNDNKRRFSLNTKSEELYIRANQGHSNGNLNDNMMLELINISLNLRLEQFNVLVNNNANDATS